MWRIESHRVARLLLIFLVSVVVPTTRAQPTPPSDFNNNYLNSTTFNPSVAILIIVLISAFFFLGFFSVYMRSCANNNSGNGASVRGAFANALARSRRQRGLEPAVLETFPTMIYSEVKEHKIGKGSLECAVCLSEFEDDENIRLLTKCDHVFHTDCIDAWLAAHVTCPVCRCNLAPDTVQPSNETEVPENVGSSGTANQEVVIDVEESEEEQRIREEAVELERIGSQRRAIRAKSVRRPPMKFPRSHSTGHSLTPPSNVRVAENVDKYTLKLPEHIQKEIIESSTQFKRSRSLQSSFPMRGEASSRRGFRFGGGEGSNRGGKSIRLGRSDRWPSFIVRNFSARVPFGLGKKPDAEGSSKGKGGGAKSSRVESAGEEEDKAAVIVR